MTINRQGPQPQPAGRASACSSGKVNRFLRPVWILHSGRTIGWVLISQKVNHPESLLGQLGRCVAWPCWLARPFHWDSARGRGRPEDPELAREADVHVDGDVWLGSPQLWSWKIGTCPSRGHREIRVGEGTGVSLETGLIKTTGGLRAEVEHGVMETPYMGHSCL